MNRALKLPKWVRRIRRGDKTLFFNPFVPAWLVTNRNGEKLLRLCNGKRTSQEIVQAIAADHDQKLAASAARFLREAEASRLFVDDTDVVVNEPDPSALRILQLSLTSQCNLKCSYCYAEERQHVSGQLLTLERYKSIVDEALELSNGLDVVLTGGEPLLSAHCIPIAEHSKQRGCGVQLLTNGTLLTEELVYRLRDSFDLVKVSLDGSSENLHEMFRGKGTYSKTTRAIEALDKAHINYSIAMTVNKLNIHDVGAMARRYGSRLSVAPLFNAGRARNQRLCVSGSEYYAALSSTENVNPLGCCEATLDSASQSKIRKCAIGDSELSISPSGNVYPCHLLHLDVFQAGNVLHDSLVSIYRTSRAIQYFRALSVDNIRGCSRCFLRYVCGGACRARAYYECGDLAVSGKFCEYEKKAFVNGIFDIYTRNTM